MKANFAVTDKKHLQLSYMTFFKRDSMIRPQRVYYIFFFKVQNTSESTTTQIYYKHRLLSLNLTAVVQLTLREEGTCTL